MKQLLLYLIAIIVLTCPQKLVWQGKVNFILSTIVLSILFYFNLREDINDFLIRFKHYLKEENEKSTKI